MPTTYHSSTTSLSRTPKESFVVHFIGQSLGDLYRSAGQVEDQSRGNVLGIGLVERRGGRNGNRDSVLGKCFPVFNNLVGTRRSVVGQRRYGTSGWNFRRTLTMTEVATHTSDQSTQGLVLVLGSKYPGHLLLNRGPQGGDLPFPGSHTLRQSCYLRLKFVVHLHEGPHLFLVHRLGGSNHLILGIHSIPNLDLETRQLGLVIGGQPLVVVSLKGGAVNI
jgi:hypothetical protein